MSKEAQLAEVAVALAARDCALLGQLTRAASTDAVRVAGCKALFEVAKTYESSPELAVGLADTALDVVELLVSVLFAEVASADVKTAGLAALSQWCDLVPQVRVPAGERGAVGAVVAAMRVDVANTLLQRWGCMALAGLLYQTPANQRPAAEADAVVSVLIAMKAHASCASVQSWACEVLAFATLDSVSGASAAVANRDAAVAHGAIELVAAALVDADAKGSELACLALDGLIALVPENAARAQCCGAFEATVAAMRVHVQQLNLQSNGCTVLGHMGLKSSTFVAAERLGAHTAIIHAMERFPADSRVQGNGCFALKCLLPAAPSPDDDAKHAGAVACMVHALQTHVASASVSRHACDALFQVVYDQPLNNAEAFRLGAFAALTEVLKTHIADIGVLQPCLEALCYICDCAVAAGSPFPVAEAEVAIRAFVAALRAYPELLHIQRQGISAICLFLLQKDMWGCGVAAAEVGVLDAAVAAIQKFIVDVDVSTRACFIIAQTSKLWSTLRKQGVQLPATPTTDVVAATLLVLRSHPGNSKVLAAAASALSQLCDDLEISGSRSWLSVAVMPLCAALLTHVGAVAMQHLVLEALAKVVMDASAAAAAVSAGRQGIGVVTELLLRSTPAQDFDVFYFACAFITNVARCAEAKLSSADAVAPLVHVLANCSQQNHEIAVLACTALLRVVGFTRQHAAEAVRLGAVAAVPAAVRAHPDVAALVALLETEAKLQADEQAQAQAQALAQAQAREEATRRADAMAAELIAEEEEAARMAATPPARKSKKKRSGGGGAAGGQRAEPASSESAAIPDAAPDLAAASAAALSELALDDATGAADTPSAAAARRRRRAATKAARKRAGNAAAGASSGDAAARGGEPASGGEDDASEPEPDAAASDALPPPYAPLPPDAAPAPTPAAPLPPPPAATMPVAMSECCVCLSDMPAAQLLVVVPCGHRCLCPDCWEQLEPPTARRCPICSAPAVMAMRVYDHL